MERINVGECAILARTSIRIRTDWRSLRALKKDLPIADTNVSVPALADEFSSARLRAYPLPIGQFVLTAELFCSVSDQLGVIVIPALIIGTSLAGALVAGMRMNMPKEGKVRSGSDAEHALNTLATAVGRAISKVEAHSVGLAFTPNAPIDPGLFNSLCLPQQPVHSQSRVQSVNRERSSGLRRLNHPEANKLWFGYP